MAIDRAQVRHVARLARLLLTSEEEERYAAQLDQVLDYIERIKSVDVSGVEPLSYAGGELSLREDVVRPGLSRERVLEQAPRHDGQSFMVPRIIE